MFASTRTGVFSVLWSGSGSFGLFDLLTYDEVIKFSNIASLLAIIIVKRHVDSAVIFFLFGTLSFLGFRLFILRPRPELVLCFTTLTLLDLLVLLSISSRIDLGDYYIYIYPISFLLGAPYIGYCYYKVIKVLRSQMVETARIAGKVARSDMEKRRTARTREAMNLLVGMTVFFYAAHLPFFVEFLALTWFDYRFVRFLLP